ncbi:MAG TPA: M56 family metallopeptidase, partial [Gemmataceae bacterium]|nr:M56 family metallopeptidase [Gemmataceae bacterium]
MNSTWPPFAGWLLHSALGGGMLLLLALPMMRACRQPAWRQRLGESALLAALALGIFNLGPSWITVPLLSPESFLSPAATQSCPDSAELLSPPRQVMESAAQSEAEAGDNQLDQDGAIAFDEAAFALMLSHLDGASPSMDGEPRDRATETSHLAFGIGSRWLSFAVVAYAAASLGLLGRWVLGYCVLWRLLRNAQPAPEPIRRVFEAMARGQGRRPRLLVSRRLRVPLSCGILRPCVVVPASFCEADAAGALRWLFAHELTHLERGDAWTCLMFGLGQALYFCLPWFWWLRRQVRLCQEYVADAAAAEQAANPEDYAQFLVSLTRAPAVPLGALGVFGNSSDLFRRVTMLLQDPLRVEKRCPRWWSLATASGLLGLALVVSGIGLRADAAQGQSTTETVVRVADETEPADPRKQEGAPEARKARKVIVIEDDEQADPKESAKKPAVEKVLRDLEELLKDLPAAVDADQIKHLQEQLKKSQREMERAFERLKEVDPSKLDTFREHLRHFQGSGYFVNEEAQRKALEAMQGHAIWYGSDHGLSGGRLGVAIQAPGTVLADQLDLPKGQGLVIEKVVPDSAAAKAGLKPHDVLLQFNGAPVPNAPAKFIKMVEEVKANTPVDAVVLRKGKKLTVQVSLSEAKAKQEQQFQFKFAPDSANPFKMQRSNTGREGSGAGSGTGRHGVITTITRTNDSFTTRYQEGSLIITVTGTVADGKSKVKHLEIQDGGKHETYNSADKVPEQYRSKVKTLIEMSEKNNVKIEVGANSQGTSSGGPVIIT